MNMIFTTTTNNTLTYVRGDPFSAVIRACCCVETSCYVLIFLHFVAARSSNVCNRMPCLRGICIQTVQDPGFTCKCEGTDFYGQRCEKGTVHKYQ